MGEVGGGRCGLDWRGGIVWYVRLRLRRWVLWFGGGKRGGLDVVRITEFVIVNAMCDGSRMYGSFFVAMYVQMIF